MTKYIFMAYIFVIKKPTLIVIKSGEFSAELLSSFSSIEVKSLRSQI